MPNFACAGFAEEDREALWLAAKTLADERGLIIRITGVLGNRAEWLGEKAAEIGSKMFGDRWQEKITELTEHALWKAHDVATLGLDPQGDHEPWRWFNKAMTIATGAAGGFFGLPGVAIDVPLTTLVMMRSIAEIARSKGENLAEDEAKRACLQVLAFGGVGGADNPEIAYWTTRGALGKGSIELLIKQAASRLGTTLSEKVLAQAVPVAGALAGGALNYVFMNYYQQMAGVHFVLRNLERTHGDEAGVRACFDNLVQQAKARKSLKRENAA
jgi:EcsC protein family